MSGVYFLKSGIVSARTLPADIVRDKTDTGHGTSFRHMPGKPADITAPDPPVPATANALRVPGTGLIFIYRGYT